jgi:hypothetical protein
VIEHLRSKHKALSSYFSTAKKENKNKEIHHNKTMSLLHVPCPVHLFPCSIEATSILNLMFVIPSFIFFGDVHYLNPFSVAITDYLRLDKEVYFGSLFRV